MDEDLLAAMYSDEKDAKSKPPIEASNQRSRKIRVGVVEYEVPTMEYVRHLEQVVAQQASAMAQMRRDITRLSSTLHGTRNFVRRQTDGIADVRQALARKVDTRQ